MTTTADNITDHQIRALRREARDAGDTVQALICDIALSTALHAPPVEIGEHRAKLETLGIIPEHVDADVRARAICADVITENQGR